MAYRCVGYGFKCSISDNGSGKARFTFAANTIHRAVHALILTDGSSYLWNFDLTATSAITAKGGTEAGGYWYDSSLDYSGLSWTTSHRLHPAPSGTISNPTSTSAARSASSHGDVWFMMFKDTTVESTVWPNDYIVSNSAALVPDVYGMAGHRTTFNRDGVTSANGIYYPTGDLSGRATQAKLVGLRMHGGYRGVYFNDTSGTGGGLLIDSCIAVGAGGEGLWINAAANAGEMHNCIVIADNVGIRISNACKIFNCVVFGGASSGLNNNNTASTIKNTVVVGASVCFANLTSVVMSYCASSDATATGTGSITSLTMTQAAFWRNNAGRYYPLEFRILTTSSLYNAGNYAAGQPTTDIDGNDITTTCPIGCHVGTVNPFAVTWPAANQVITGNDFTSFSGAQTASATAESHTANQVLKSAGGNYNDDNLAAANVRKGSAFGLSQTGLLSPGGAPALGGHFTRRA